MFGTVLNFIGGSYVWKLSLFEFWAEQKAMIPRHRPKRSVSSSAIGLSLAENRHAMNPTAM